jgi:RNA polymerase sigma-70 factor (family 1)
MKTNNDLKISVLWQNICCRDDNASYEILFHLLNSQLIKFSEQYIHVRQVAEEIVVDAFLKCWMKRHELAQVDNPKAYLYTTVKNQSLNHRKKYSSMVMVDLNQDNNYELVDVSNPHLQMEKKELIAKLNSTIDNLPPQCRMVFKLIKEDGLKYKEVAELLDISPRTVQNHLFAAILKLNERLGAYFEKNGYPIKEGFLVFVLFKGFFPYLV